MDKMAEWHIPVVTVSEANRSSEHWTKKHKRHNAQKLQVRSAFNEHMPKIKLPCRVKMTRISPRSLDFDNLVSSFKWIRDEVGAKLTGNNIPGRGDGDERITWEYAQEKGKSQAIRLEIFS
jgi:hypothetical protein